MLDRTKSKIEICKGVPLPPGGGKGRPSLYPFREMEVGDSFVFPSGTPAENARTAAAWAGKRQGRKFCVRKIPEGIACWRVA